ncbi:MAG TPA: DNA repair protein RecN [Candidatus Polarisedimenticolaceae bacterium]
MLRTLRIRNVAVVEELTVEFGAGLNVLTGETGAGKSILVDALGLAAGERSSASLVRSGSDRAIVEAVFEPPFPSPLEALLDARGVERGEDGLVVKREVASSGGGRVFVNGSPTTVAVLREIGGLLVELHGQHEHQSLLAGDRQLDLLDARAGAAEAADRVAAAWDERRRKREALEHLRDAARDREARIATLREVVREIDALDPRPGERERLDRERRVLQHAERVARLLEEATDALHEGEPSAAALAASAARRVAELAEIDPGLAELARRVETARLELQDAGATLGAWRDRADFDPARLEGIATRLAALDRLLLRYGPDEEAALATREAAEAERAQLEDVDRSIEQAERAAEEAEAAYAAAAKALSERRRAAAAVLSREVETQLGALALVKARFAVALREGPPGPRGAERAEFLLAANPGEPSRPLAQTASGGELSRVMLALHLVLEGAGSGRVLVFDEVDAGVGGAVAAAVGARLGTLAGRHQVLCVTHLPQVAAHASRHYHVRKRVAEGRTSTDICALDGAARVEELARMLGGRELTEGARRNAEELLVEAGTWTAPRPKTRRGA